MRSRGFTLVELLVVIGILMLLIAIIAPAGNKAYQQAIRARMRADLATIAQALEAYRADFGDYPRPDRNVPGALQGAVVLCWGLVAPGPAVSPSGGHGADGPGFRLHGTSGKVWGPYLNVNQFKLMATDNQGTLSAAAGTYDNLHTVIVDRYNNPVLYYPRKTKATASSLSTYFGPLNSTPRYVFNDNNPAYAPLAGMQAQLPGVLANGAFDMSQVLELPYLLWSAGTDGQFGTADDVANFR